jgi:hypothetical protein
MFYGHYIAIARRLQALKASPEPGAPTDELVPLLRTVDLWSDQTSADEFDLPLPAALIEFNDLPLVARGDGTSHGQAQITIHLLVDLADSEGLTDIDTISQGLDDPIRRADSLSHAVHSALERFDAIVTRTPDQADAERPYSDSYISAMTISQLDVTTPYPGIVDFRLRFASVLSFTGAQKPASPSRKTTFQANFVAAGAQTYPPTYTPPTSGGGGAGSTDALTLAGQPGSYYLDRANHTGTQLADTISDLHSYLYGHLLAS